MGTNLFRNLTHVNHQKVSRGNRIELYSWCNVAKQEYPIEEQKLLAMFFSWIGEDPVPRCVHYPTRRRANQCGYRLRFNEYIKK